MPKIEQLDTWADLASHTPSNSVTIDSNHAIANQPADAHWVSLKNDQAVARCSAWSKGTGLLEGYDHVGAIGHFASDDAEASETLLNHVVDWLKSENCDVAVGPLDRDTWHRYRFITARGTQPLFYMEPDNDDAWPDHFRTAGFDVLGTYHSLLVRDLTHRSEKLARVDQRIQRDGIRIRPVNLDRFEDELRAIHHMSLTSFAGNFLYSPVDADTFVAMYAPMKAAIQPDLVLLAEDPQNQLMGYIFTFIDPTSAHSPSGPTLIVKTLAVLPTRRCAGLGGLLLEKAHLAADAMGCQQAIHALVFAQNQSINLSQRYAETFRTYQLFAKDLRR